MARGHCFRTLVRHKKEVESEILTERGLAHQSGAEQRRWKDFFADFDWPLAVH